MSSPTPDTTLPGTSYMVVEGAVLYGRVSADTTATLGRPARDVIALHSMKAALLAELLTDLPASELAFMRTRLTRILWAVEEAMDAQGAFTRTITQEPA